METAAKYHLLEEGRCHRTKEAAELHREALLSYTHKSRDSNDE